MSSTNPGTGPPYEVSKEQRSDAAIALEVAISAPESAVRLESKSPRGVLTATLKAMAETPSGHLLDAPKVTLVSTSELSW